MEKETRAMFMVYDELRLEGSFCDVVLQVSSAEFKAHKIILSGCSSYFRALFTRWSDSHVHSIPSVSPAMMQLIIQFAYQHVVPVTVENVEELLVAADQLLVPGVVAACCDFLEAQLSPENCVGIWRLTDVYHCPDLRRAARLFVVSRFEEVVRVSEEFVEMSLQQLADVIETDELNVRREETVFEAVLRWVDHHREERQAHLPALLPKVRMGLMEPDYFLNNVQNNPVVRDSDACWPAVLSPLTCLSDLTTDRLRHPLACPRLPHELLLAIGGCSVAPTTNVTEVFDIRADRWMDMSDGTEGPWAYHDTAYLGGLVYCVGGFDGEEYSSSVRRFDPVTCAWRQAAPMHSRRWDLSVAVLDGCLYAMGGFDGQAWLNTVERYDPETNQWTQIAPMLERRSGAKAAVLHGKVYICGGFNGADFLDTAECYSPESGQWTLIAPMSSRRSGVAVAAYEGQVYVVGGLDGVSRLSSVEAYSPSTDSWRALPAMLTPRSNCGIAVLDGLLLVAGGFGGFSAIRSVERYDQGSDRWTAAPDMGIPRGALSCCVVHSAALPGALSSDPWWRRRGGPSIGEQSCPIQAQINT